MSTTIDQKVVEMRFDNKQFESGAQQSMSTLEKLKQSLNLTGSSKGLENVANAAGKLNSPMSTLGSAVETVRTKFSALEVMGVTALANITNSAVNAGKRIVHALTIAPVSDGFKEYELMLNSIQTTMAGTGKTAKEVEEELKKLDEYADKTVYSTSDMLNNLPKFTNAGVELEKATTAMIGIANATALAGGDAGKASIAFYNLGQAIGTGYLTRMDYNSINNAGIATMEWKNQMVEAAIAAGTLKKVGNDLYEAGGKTMTLQQLFIEGLQHQWATTDVMMKVFQDYGDETTEIGQKSYAAAQDIKTYTQMMESLKATAGTGWKDTWQAIFGDLDAAKEFWTGLTNFISGIITKTADIRNKILDIAMGSPLTKMAKKIESITDTVKSAVKPLEIYEKVADRIMAGEFGNQWDNGDPNYRKKRVEAAGYDYATAQNIVNERKGISLRLTSELTKAEGKLAEQQSKSVDELAELSEKQLEQLGYNKEQIKAIKTLSKYAKDAGVPLSEFIKNLDEMSGREMLIESFKNAGQGLATVFNSMKDAFLEIFPISAESIGLRIYSILMKLYDFSQRWDISENADTIDKLTRTFKGLFAALDIVTTIISGPVKIAWKIFNQLLSVFDLDILSVTAAIGDAIVKFRDWLDSIIDFTGVFELIAPYIKDAIQAVKDWIAAVKPMEKIAELFKKVGDAIKNFGKSVWESDIVQNIIDGLTNGLKGGATKVWNAIVEMAKGMIAKIKAVLGIHSPSTEFEEVGENAVDGLVLGLKNGISSIGDVIKALCAKMFDVFGNLDWGSISSLFMNLAKVFPQLKILNFISGLGGLFSIGGKDVMAGLANGIGEGAAAVWNAIETIATSLIEKFKAVLGIHSPSKVFFAIGGFIIAGLIGGIMNGEGSVKEALMGIGNAFINFFKNLDLGTVIAGGAGIGALLIFKEIFEIIDKFGDAAKGVANFADSMGDLAKIVKKDGLKGLLNGESTKVSKFASIAKSILTIAGAIAMLAGVVIIFTKIDAKSLWGAIGAVTVLAGVMIGLMAAVNMMEGHKKIKNVGPMLMQVAGAIAIMAVTAKILGSMSPGDMWQGVIAVGAFAVIIGVLMAATKKIAESRNVGKIGPTLLKIAGAMLIMALVAKIAGTMDPDKLIQGGLAIAAFAVILGILMVVTRLLTANDNVGKIGGTLLKVAGAIAIMLIVAKLAAKMTPEDFNRGYLAIVKFAAIIVALMWATKYISGSKNVGAIGGAILGVAGAMAIMIIVAKIAASMSPQEMARGIASIIAFGGIVIALMWATKLIGDSKNVEKIGIAILSVSGAIAAMVIAAKIAATMSPSELATGLIAVTAFSAIIVGLMAAVKLIGGAENADKLGKTILMIGVSIGIMAVAVALLSLIDPKRLAGATVALSMIMGMFALVIKAASNMKSAIASLIVITVAIGVLSFILYKLSELPVESTLGTAAALSVLLLSLAGSLAILSLMKTVPWAAIGAIALMGLVVAELGLILGAMSHFNVGVSLETVVGVSALLLVMTGVLAVLALMGPMVSTAFVGIGALAVLGLVVGELAIILGLMAHFDVNPSIETSKSLSLLLISMSGALLLLAGVGLLGPAAFIGIGALATLIAGIGGLLVAIGALVTKFPQLEEFLNVGIPILEKIGYALGSFFGNIIGGFVDGALEFIPELGAKLGEFMTNAQPFIDGAKSIDPTVMEGVKSLAEAILILTGANILEGIGRFLGFGDSSLANFGSQLGSLGTNLATFVTNLGTFTEEQVTTVDCAGKAIKALADAAGEIPADGGWIAVLFGDNSISTFGSKLPQLGTDLKGFVTNLGTFSEEQVTTVDCAGKAIKALAEAAKDIPNEGGLWGVIAGDNGIAAFGSKLPQLGTDLKNFVGNLGTFSDSQVTTVRSAVDAINALATLSGEGTDVSKISDLGRKLNTFAKKIGEFANKMGEISADSITTATNKLKTLISTVNDISSANTEAAEKFAQALKTLGQNGVDKFVEAFTTDAATSKVKSAAETMLKNFISGLKSKNEDIKEAGETVGSKAASGMGSKTTKEDAKSAGKDLGDGLVLGIQAKETAAYNAGYALGQKAVQGEKDGQQSASPSKATIRAGKWLGEGLIIGMQKMNGKVYDAGSELGESATGTLSSVISRISDAINSDIDAQPTIRPVLDLSDVRAGANTIGSMFDSRATVGVSGNINAISAMMNQSQNGANDDIVSAINKLRKDIGNVGGTQYNINGVTYDDGTNVSEAVKSLVRAVRIEGRI